MLRSAAGIQRAARLAPVPVAGRAAPPVGRRAMSSIAPGVQRLLDEVDDIPPECIRNFCIIAHIDHGKSTLADRMLEFTENLRSDDGNKQVLDNLQVERERGITVRSQTATMLYRHPGTGESYLLNLIDTPGHVDFSYEVSRSLSACQGALLLVDSAQGIQAQTFANYRTASKAELKIVPVLTKMDLPNADVNAVDEQVRLALDLEVDDVIPTSAKTGEGVDLVFEAIIEHVPPPTPPPNAPLRAMLFDSHFDEYRGVITSVRVVEGELRTGQRLHLTHANQYYEAQEVGLLTPARQPVSKLHAGQVGYIIAGIKTAREARVGDTFVDASRAGKVEPLGGFQDAKPMVFASMYPTDSGAFVELAAAVEKLALNDPSVSMEKESSGSIGMGLRCGFLGLLHMDVFHERLMQEYGMPVILTAPMVPYTARMVDGSFVQVEKPSQLPVGKHVEAYLEPMIQASIVTPQAYVGNVIQLLQSRRGEQKDMLYIDDDTVVLKYSMPWQEVASDFYDRLKSTTQGYGSFDYEPGDLREADIVKVDILLNGNPLDELSFVCHRKSATKEGRGLAKKLKEVIRRQQFEVVIQAAVAAKIFAKERIPPFRKDVLNKSGKTVGGGDETRKKKLLKNQAAGKKRMKHVGKVEIPQEAFMAVMRRNE